MTQHTITNIGPVALIVICADDTTEVVQPGSILTAEIKRIIHPPQGRVEYAVHPID